MLRKIIDALTVTFDQDNARLLNKTQSCWPQSYVLTI